MFKENTKHEMPELFSEKNQMPDNLKKKYEKSWAKKFYENVFANLKHYSLNYPACGIYYYLVKKMYFLISV